MWLHYQPKQVRKGWERVKIKIIVPFRSYPTRNRKFKKKKSKKTKKFKKIPLLPHFKPKQVGRS